MINTNRITSEFYGVKRLNNSFHSKIGQKEYKTRYYWVGKVIHEELNFDLPIKWYMHNRASIIENETHKIPWNFELQTNRPIVVRRPYRLLMNKKRTYGLVDFTVSADDRVKIKEREKIV